MYHTDAQWDLTSKVKVFNLLAGGDARIYQIIPDGNNFVDFSRPVAERNKLTKDGDYGDYVYYKNMALLYKLPKPCWPTN